MAMISLNSTFIKCNSVATWRQHTNRRDPDDRVTSLARIDQLRLMLTSNGVGTSSTTLESAKKPSSNSQHAIGSAD